METEASREAMVEAARMEITNGEARIDKDRQILKAIGYEEQGA